MGQQDASITIVFKNDPVPLVYPNIQGYQLGSGFLGVMVGTDTFIYPAESIESIVHTVKE